MRGVDTFVALKTQADFATPRAIGDLAAGDFLAFNSESVSGSQTIFTSPAIRRQAMQNKAFSANGTVRAEGDIEFTASNLILDKILPLIFHSKTGTADDEDGEGATYTFTDGGVVPSFSAFIGFDGPEGVFTRRFNSCKVNTANISVRVDSLLLVRLGIAAVSKDILTATTTPVYSGGTVEYGYTFSDARVMILAGDMAALGEVPVDSIDININHNLSLDRYRLGSIYRRSLQEGITAVTGSFNMAAFDSSISGSAMNLAGGGTHDPAFFERIAQEGRYAEIQFDVIDTTKLIDGNPCRFTVNLPFCRLEEPGFNVSDGGILTGSVNFNAYDNITAVHIAELS